MDQPKDLNRAELRKWRVERLIELLGEDARLGRKTVTVKRVAEMFDISPPNANKLIREARALLDEGADDTPPERLPNEQERARERLVRTKELFIAARMQGHSLGLAEIQEELGVNKSSAARFLALARGELAQEGLLERTTAIVLRPETEPVPSPLSGVKQIGRYVESGIDFLQEMLGAANEIKKVCNDLIKDAQQARYFLLGAPQELMPGYCRACGAKEFAKLSIRNQPKDLRVGYSDVASLLGQAIKGQAAIAKISSDYSNQLGQFYYYDAMARYMADVQQAIANTVPERAKDIAAEIRRLQTISTGTKSRSEDDDEGETIDVS